MQQQQLNRPVIWSVAVAAAVVIAAAVVGAADVVVVEAVAP